MKNNMGKVDRTIRFILGAIIIGLGIYFKTWLGIIGAIFLITALMGLCPAYIPFKISTIGKERGTKD